MPFDSLLSLDGRVDRRRYLGFLVGAWIVYALLCLGGEVAFARYIDTTFRSTTHDPWVPQVSSPIAIALAVLVLAGAVVIFCVAMSFAVRRLHDMNLTGNWNWLILVLPVIPIPTLPQLDLPFPPSPASGFLVWHAVLLLVPGSPGRNRFGPKIGHADDQDIVDVFGDKTR